MREEKDTVKYIASLLANAREAQEIYAKSSQKQLDKTARAAAKIVYDNAAILAEEAVEETGMGTVEGKILKMKAAMKSQWCYAKDKKSTGVIGWEQGKLNVDCILKIAKPAGVIAAVMPSTNPTTNMGSNCMQALKGGNAIIICPHPRAAKVSVHCADMIREAIVAVGAPANLVQCVEDPGLEDTAEAMHVCDLTVATGGPSIVEAANSSGKPNFGVGQGNCQLIIDKGMMASYDKIADGAITSRSWDSGIPCTSEQTLIIPVEEKDAIVQAFDRNGAYVIDDEEIIDKLRKLLFVENGNGGFKMNAAYVGKNVQDLGKLIGVEIPANKRTMLVKLSGYGTDELLCKEKLCPVTGYITYSNGWEEAIKIAKTNLLMEGTGHSSDIYTNDKDHELYAGLELPVCRLIVNNSNQACSGEPYHSNGLIGTHGLGCGFWQGNITSEHVNFAHYLNITRVIYTVDTGERDLTDEEIWAEN